MVRIQTEIKVGLLRQIAETAKRNAQTLREALLQFQANIGQQPNFQRGRTLIGTSGSGQSGSFQAETTSTQLSPAQNFALSEEYFGVLDSAIEQGQVDAADGEVIDTLFAYIKANYTMLIKEAGITAQQIDATGLNFPNYAPGVA